MNGSSKKNNKNETGTRSRDRNKLLPALIVAGGACGFAAGPAAAIELGDLNVESTLGQPLRASISYALNSHEELYEFCIFLKSGQTDGGLQYLSRANISISSSAIVLTGNTPIGEPMLAMQVSVDCPYTAHLARNYTVMFNPAGSVEPTAQAEIGETLQPAAAGQQAAAGERQSSRAAAEVDLTPVTQAADYRVQPGDSLSGIASRIEGRDTGLWPAVNTIFAANPHAFTDNDVNQLKAGSVLRIPDLASSQATNATAAQLPAAEPVDVIDESGARITQNYSGYTVPQAATTATDDTAVLDSGAIDAFVEFEDVQAEADSTASDLQPGDIIVDSDGPATTPIDSTGDLPVMEPGTIVIPDTAADAPAPATVSGGNAQSDGSWTWLLWLGGSGLALIVGLLLFARRIRERFAPDAGSAFGDSKFDRRKAATPEEEMRKSAANVDYIIESAAADGPMLSLDADLSVGTGLQTSTDVDVAQDFGFSADTGSNSVLDLEIPEAAAVEPEQQPTDIIPPARAAEGAIVDREVPPGEADGEYDLSMIVDATKQAIGEMEDTAKDLMAIQIGSADRIDETSMLTISKDVDYRILEQDYEEELTATQVLNEEIARAALQLAERMDNDDATGITENMPGTEPTAEMTAPGSEPTAEMPIANVDAGDLTSEMPAATVDDGDLTAEMLTTAADAADLTAEVPAVSADELDITGAMPKPDDLEITGELTAKLPLEADAENEEFSDLDDTGVNEELTAEMPREAEDPTVEMEIESGTVDTKKNIKAS